jgi:hypothetical protein
MSSNSRPRTTIFWYTEYSCFGRPMTLYAEIDSLVKQRTPQREEYMHSVIDAVEEDLRDLRIRGRVMGLGVQLRVQDGERQILQFALDGLDAETVRERRVDLERLRRLLRGLARSTCTP